MPRGKSIADDDKLKKRFKERISKAESDKDYEAIARVLKSYGRRSR